jgi:hypothetical protein
MTKQITASTKTIQKTEKTFQDNPHSDETIRNVGKLISIGYSNNDISKYLNIRHETVSRIRSYLKRISWSSKKFVKLAHTNVEKALEDGNLQLSEKVLDHANKAIEPVQAQQQQNVQVNVYNPDQYQVNDD